MSYLLDTNVVSELRKGDRCDARVAAWFGGVEDNALYLSILVVGEIRRGMESIRRRDLKAASALDSWLLQLENQYAERLLPVDMAVADEWGRMNAVRPLSTVDSLLAATAKVHGLTLATRNVKDVEATGVEVLNPFESQG